VSSLLLYDTICVTLLFNHITQALIDTYQLHNRLQYRQLEAQLLDHTAGQQVTGFQALRLNPEAYRSSPLNLLLFLLHIVSFPQTGCPNFLVFYRNRSVYILHKVKLSLCMPWKNVESGGVAIAIGLGT